MIVASCRSLRTPLHSLLIALILPGAALHAAAQEAEPPPAPKKDLPWRSTEVRLGVFFTSSDAGLEVKSDAGVGASVDFEDVLGMSESTLAFRGEASFSLGARHRIHLDVFSLSREGDKSLANDLQIGNTVFPAGTGVKSESEFQMYMLTYGYSLIQDERMDLAVTFGIHGIRSTLEVNAEVIDRHKSANLFLPIPLPGLRFDTALTPDLWLRQRAEFIWIAAGPYSGILSDLSIRLEYAFAESFSAGIGFNSLQIKLNSSNDDAGGVGFEGNLEMGFSGLMLYVGASF